MIDQLNLYPCAARLVELVDDSLINKVVHLAEDEALLAALGVLNLLVDEADQLLAHAVRRYEQVLVAVRVVGALDKPKGMVDRSYRRCS